MYTVFIFDTRKVKRALRIWINIIAVLQGFILALASAITTATALWRPLLDLRVKIKSLDLNNKLATKYYILYVFTS
jgi:hypothetical protein